MYRDKSFFPIKTLVFGFSLFLMSFLNGTGYELKYEKIIIPRFEKHEEPTLENNLPIVEISQIESSSDDAIILEDPELSEFSEQQEEEPSAQDNISLNNDGGEDENTLLNENILFEDTEEKEDEESVEFLNYDFKMPIW